MLRVCLACLLAALLSCAPAWAQRAPIRHVEVTAAESPVRMTREHIAIDIGGGMAETTLEMVFHNPGARVLEVPLRIPLAPGQRVVGFALDMNGEMVDAVPVEKTRGRQVFEAIERRGVDPGLLQAAEGNSFQLRLYPVMPNGERRVRLRIAQALERSAIGWTYRLPLPPRMDDVDLEATLKVHGSATAPTLPDTPARVAFQPDADGVTAELPRAALARGLTVTGRLDAAARAWVGDFGDASYFYAEVPVTAPARARALPRTIGLLWDSSGSGAARRHDLEFALLERYLRAACEANGEVEVTLIRLRDRAEAARTFHVRGGDWSQLRRELESTVYDGATALGGWTPARGVDDYLLFSDGIENYGARRFPALGPAQRLFAIDASPSADSARLDALARQYHGRLLHLNAGATDAADAAIDLLNDPPRIAALAGDGLAELQAESMEARGGLLRIAGRRLRPDASLRVTLAGGQAIDVPVKADSPRQPLAPLLWALWRIDALQAEPVTRRAEVARLSRRFGIATRDTSLIVLERPDDYVQYGIDPPQRLRQAVDRLRGWRLRRRQEDTHAHLERVVRELDDKLAWWKTRYPKDRPEAPVEKPPVAAGVTAWNDSSGAFKPGPGYVPAPPPPPAPVAAAPVLNYADPVATSTLRRAAPAPAVQVSVTGSNIAAPPSTAPIGIALRKWAPDERYLERMRHADAAQAYAIYLDEKPDFADSSAFYLDVADQLLDKGARELALRVLSNLAEMDLDNRQVLRVLGARLMQAGAPELAVPVLEQVRELADDEPQSWRDLGLVYAAVGRTQDAVDALAEVALRPWDARFAEIELITLADMNAIIAASRAKLDTSRIDPRLLRPMPLDLRVVLTWDADNTDMDLWVLDPNGERCMYSHRLTYQGGRMSRDVTGGYGPEEFSLREAKPGKYKVEVNFYGHRQQLLSSSTTLQVKLVTGFGTPRAREKMVTLRLRGRGETVFVGEFEVPASRR